MQGSTKLRLLLADDHTIVREGLKQLLVLVPDMHVVGEAENGTQLMERLKEQAIDLLLLDMTMPGITGEDAIGCVRKHHPGLPILVLSMHNELQIALRALKAGAQGYVTKDRDPETLLAAVRQIASGGRFLDPALAERMAFEISGFTDKPDHACLTEREFQVLQLLARGLRVNDIALELSISNKTVSTHKARLMGKMDFRSNAALVRYAIEHDLVS